MTTLTTEKPSVDELKARRDALTAHVNVLENTLESTGDDRPRMDVGEEIAEAKGAIDALGVEIAAVQRVEEETARERSVDQHDDLLEDLYGALGALEKACQRLEDFEKATAHPGPPWVQWRDDARGRCVTWRRRLHRADARTWKAHSV